MIAVCAAQMVPTVPLVATILVMSASRSDAAADWTPTSVSKGVVFRVVVALAGLVAATIGMARQPAPVGPTIHIGTMDFASGALTVPSTGVIPAAHGSYPVWNANGSQLLYLSTTTDAGVARTALTVESNGTVRAVPIDIDVDEMSASTDPNVVLIGGKNASSESGLFQVDIRSGQATVVVAGNMRAGFISEDKRRFYFFRGEGGHHDLVRHDLASRRERTILSYEHAPNIPESAYVSPDGARVYYRMPEPDARTPEPQSRLIERDLVSGRERNLLSGRLGHLRPSPDGKYAVVRQDDPAGKWVSMTLVPLVDARPPSDVMRTENPNLFFSFWSPDSRSVILQMPQNGRPTSWWVPLDGRSPRALPQFIGGAAVHPNGRTVAFAANDR